MKRIRVLIVDDSAVSREVLRALLEQEADMEVVAEAGNGREALELIRSQRPDLVTMDLNMPVMDGMAAISEIMHEKAVPILVVSGEADAEKACAALEAGALEVIGKPDYLAPRNSEFVAKVRMLAGVPVITRMRRRAVPPPPSAVSRAQVTPLSRPHIAPAKGRDYRLVFAIASSTGGPQALAHILPQLPAHFPAPILVAQHMCDGFVEGMAQWLSGLCAMSVKVAEEGELLRAGCIYISPSETHLTVTANHRVALMPRTASDIYRPCCDQLLGSVAEVYQQDAIGLILTGMGRDGAQGIAQVHAGGGLTLAQDEASSVIYGMNHEAVLTGAVDLELPLEQIGAELQRIVTLSPHGYRRGLHRSQA